MANSKKAAAGSSVVVILLLVVLALFKLFTGGDGGGGTQSTATEPTHRGERRRGDIPRTEPAKAGDYLFCFWNVENYFDDVDDGRKRRDDDKYDKNYSADGGKTYHAKTKKIADILLQLNDGKGPDILALAEVETETAADGLRWHLNERLQGKAEPYHYLLYKDPKGGRDIANVILTRLPVRGDRTQLLGSRLRILQGHIEVLGHELVVIASHWTSRLSDEEGAGRSKYADQIFGQFKAMHMTNPKVDLLVCGDFNDNPDDDSVVKHLRATGDRKKLAGAGEPMLFNLFANRPAKEGTLWYSGKPFIFDQIVVSPGLLDDVGWTCLTETATIVTTPQGANGRPLRFVDEPPAKPTSTRRTAPQLYDGWSDHFPVTVMLRVKGK